MVENTNLARFELLHEGDVVSVALFRTEGDRIIVPHVETDPAHRGNDFMAELMEGLLSLLRGPVARSPTVLLRRGIRPRPSRAPRPRSLTSAELAGELLADRPQVGTLDLGVFLHEGGEALLVPGAESNLTQCLDRR